MTLGWANVGVPHVQPPRQQLSHCSHSCECCSPMVGSNTPSSSCLPLPAWLLGTRGEAVDGGGKDGEKGSWGGWGSKNWALPEKWSETSRGERENIRWAPGQTIFRYASVRASCQTTPLNSCSPTATKTVLFASGFWPRAVSTALLPAGTGAYSRPLMPMGRPELARGGWGHPWPPPCVG